MNNSTDYAKIRQENLRQIVAQRFNGKMSAFDAAMGWKGKRTSPYLSGRKPIGNQTAIGIEGKLGLLRGTLDNPKFKNDINNPIYHNPLIGMELSIAYALQRFQEETGTVIPFVKYQQLIEACINYVKATQTANPNLDVGNCIENYVHLMKHKNF